MWHGLRPLTITFPFQLPMQYLCPYLYHYYVATLLHDVHIRLRRLYDHVKGVDPNGALLKRSLQIDIRGIIGHCVDR